ncbi:MAG: prepilin peptidase [bacterium]
MLELIATFPPLMLIIAGVVGLLVGSFLNVVILRIPPRMEYEWKQQCLELDDKQSETAKPPGIVKEPSHCPNCKHTLSATDNIPLFSYLFLKGKCRYCGTKISIQYPLIELITAVATVLVAWHFGLSWQLGPGLIFTWMLIALSGIDFKTTLLPDMLTLPLLWIGLIASLYGFNISPEQAIIGAVAGYLSLWSVYQLFKLITGKEGMGYGDFKLLAAIGAFTGWQALPITILLSSVVGAVFGLTAMVIYGREHDLPMPFGPYLATAGWIALLWGDQIIQAYLRYSGLSW